MLIMMTDHPELPIYTIGHSSHSEERFLELLAGHDIEVVVDVRSRPYSRFAPHFNRDALTKLLEGNDLRYLFLGRELGGKPQVLEKSLADEVVWEHLRSRPQFREGLDRLLREARQARVCLLCAEADPARCHRGQFLAPELAARGASVLHILADGRLLSQADLRISSQPSQKRLFS